MKEKKGIQHGITVTWTELLNVSLFDSKELVRGHIENCSENCTTPKLDRYHQLMQYQINK
jgi:hypothetical protein